MLFKLGGVFFIKYVLQITLGVNTGSIRFVSL